MNTELICKYFLFNILKLSEVIKLSLKCFTCSYFLKCVFLT